MAIEKLAWGLAIGGVVGAVVSDWWRKKVDREQSEVPLFYRHKETGKRYEQVCEAVSRGGSGPAYKILKTEAELRFNRIQWENELWTDEEIRLLLDVTDPPWVEWEKSQATKA